MQADAPDTSKIPPEDVVGVTVVLLTCSYKSSEFVRVGYYVNNEYTDAELAENLPAPPVFEKVGQQNYNTYPVSGAKVIPPRVTSLQYELYM